MKNHIVNRDKIYEAFVLEPYDAPKDDLPFGGYYVSSHGWQVVLIMGYDAPTNSAIKITIDKTSEEACDYLIKSLGFMSV